MRQNFVQPNCNTCSTRGFSLFCDLLDKEIEQINVNKFCNRYKKGQIIFSEGNHPNGLYCINYGKIKLYKIGFDGKEQIVRLAKDGDLVGYRALISGERYTATASALDDSILCSIPRDTFFQLLNGNHSFSAKMIKLLTVDLRSAEDKMVSMANKPVKERLAEGILLLKEYFGTDKDGATIKSILTREEIANLVGTATETAIRLLSELKQEKIIELNGKSIKILNLKNLIHTANLID